MIDRGRSPSAYRVLKLSAGDADLLEVVSSRATDAEAPAQDNSSAEKRRARVPGARTKRTWGIGTVVLGLTALMVVAILGSLTTERGADRTRRAVWISAAFQQAAAGVASEQSLEREYRINPTTATLSAHLDARDSVEAALAQVKAVGSTADRALVAKVLAQHAQYLDGVSQLFTAVNTGEPTAVISELETGVVDPIFTDIHDEIQGAAVNHQSTALHQAATMQRTSQLVFTADGVALVGGFALMIVAALRLARSQRRLKTQSALNHHQALHDSLTGLPNRALFHDRAAHALRAAVRSGSQVAVMLIDLNRFKDVNDTLGHHYGDLLLEQVAQRFTASLRVNDSVARLGGDEFAVLLIDTDAAAAAVAAERLTEALREPFVIKGMALDVEASIGIALADENTDVESALRHADVAMYEAKSQHAPFATYEFTRDSNTVARLTLLGDLRRAISGQELSLHYQPKVNALTGELHSVEALVRWHHPTRGLLSPDSFIPIAESTAVIHPLTAEVLRQALMQARVWLEQGWQIPVAVNVSARSLLDLSFPDHIQRLLETTRVPASLLTLELTESAFMGDKKRALVVLDALNTMGVCLSIDDFGTGYSSMAYLKALPVRELKIDRSFVRGMATSENDVVLVRSAVELGHNLGLHVVAEGVEDGDTQRVLSAMGCDLVQGYYIQRPTTAAELDGWLRVHAASASRS
jgi:diguanylate cyclase (GGDEF)-like protein